MKPAPFEYAAPRSLDEALRLLDTTATPLAGGQSLVPMLNFRFARPELIVDLNGVEELDYVREEDGMLRIGAMARQAALERSRLVASRWPIITQAVRYVGHPATRSRGTVGGSVAHADPAAELPVALAALDARFRLRSSSGERELSADEFFRGPMFTARRDDELVTEIEVPAPPEGSASAFVEYAATHGDWAIAGAAVVAAPGGPAAIALLAAGPVPVRAREAEAAFAAGAGAAEVAALAAAPIADEHRRALTAELVRRALERPAA
jgi:CO/xanthine dehydrogenase FAD-binding subunit